MADIALSGAAPRYDVVVIGSGASGLGAAVYAALAGAKVLVVERTEFVGGTSALSGGTVWAPGTKTGAKVNDGDSREAVSAFLDSAVGNFGEKALREAFLEAAPEAIDTLEAKTRVEFRPCPRHPDYEWEGTVNPTLNGRAIEPVPYDTREMGELRNLIRPPIAEFTILGGMNIDRIDIGHLLNRYKSPASFLHVVKTVLRFASDKVRYGRHARTVMGAALIARLLHTAQDLGIDLLRNAEVTGLLRAGGDVTGVTLKVGGETRDIETDGGVILATGGFGRSQTRRAALLPAQLGPDSPSAPGHTGALHDIAEAAGAVYGEGNDQNAFWAPCSTRTRKDGSLAVYPHFVFDRSKPGTVCVDIHGKRFMNESKSYHVFGKTMLENGPDTAYAWIVTDAKAIAKYGLGMVRPGGDDLKPYLADGYLLKADTIAELAQKTGTDPVLLAESVAAITAAAKTGEDPQFRRGSTEYQRHNGDAKHEGRNPTLGAIETPPFYAVKIAPADIGTAKGFRSDTGARLLRADGSVIEGLYAVGNDLHSIMGGTYPGPGITIGPGLVFGSIAGRGAAARALSKKGQDVAA